MSRRAITLSNDMILRARAKKANGLNGSAYWYVCEIYTKPDGTPSFTISQDINRAHGFTPATASEFNKRFMDLGVINAPFELK